MDNPLCIEVGKSKYPVKYESSNSLASSARIKDGFVVLKVSRFLIGRQRDITVDKFLSWATKKLGKTEVGSFVLPVYKDGGKVFTHNKVYEISVLFEERKNAKGELRDGHYICISLPLGYKKEIGCGGKIKFLVEKVIMGDQEQYLKEVIEELNQLYFQADYNACRFKRTQFRFGSCSTKKNINLSYRLLFAPREVFRYVCAHELAHLLEFNHSKRFWNLVEEAIPDYKKHDGWLKNNGFLLK